MLGRQQAQHTVWFLGVSGAHTEQSPGKLEGSTSCVIVKKKVCGACVRVRAHVHTRTNVCVHREREDMMALHISPQKPS